MVANDCISESERKRLPFFAIVYIATLLIAYWAGPSPNTGGNSPTVDEVIRLSTSADNRGSNDLGTVEQPQEGLLKIDFEVDGDFDGRSLRHLCDNTGWVEGRIIWCAPVEGGIGNVRNAILTCLRYSIASGSAVVMPSLRLRGELGLDSANLRTGGTSDMSFFFDEPFFRGALKDSCPQLQLLEEADLPTDRRKENFPEPFTPRQLYKWATGEPIEPTIHNAHAASFRHDFDFVMGSRVPVIYRLTWPLYFEWPVLSDPPAFWNNFGRILKFRGDSTALASQVYLTLGSMGSAYFGVHLRTEGDVLGHPGWATVEEQLNAYVDLCAARGLDLMYVAGGDLISIELLTQRALVKNIIVVHKRSLLSHVGVEQLEAMHFDLQAEVDFLVLLKSTHFSGVGMSSFAANIAIRRHMRLSREMPFQHHTGDSLSTLIRGEYANNFQISLYP